MSEADDRRECGELVKSELTSDGALPFREQRRNCNRDRRIGSEPSNIDLSTTKRLVSVKSTLIMMDVDAVDA
jgi:hypothetical protein